MLERILLNGACIGPGLQLCTLMFLMLGMPLSMQSYSQTLRQVLLITQQHLHASPIVQSLQGQRQ